MDAFTACMVADGEFELAGIDTSADDFDAEATYFEALQFLKDSGMAMTMPGRYGRAVQAALDNGDIS